MNFKEFLQQNIVILDGGMGTLLQERGLQPGEQPERWNLSHPEDITAIAGITDGCEEHQDHCTDCDKTDCAYRR